MNFALETNLLTKRYGDKAALDGVSIRLEKGRIYGLVGNNGAGKSTLFRIFAGFVLPTGGEYSLLGAKNEAENRAARARTGFLLQSLGFTEDMTAFQNLTALQKLRGYTDAQEIVTLTDRIGLDAARVKRAPVRTYSYGQKQRLAVAAALLHKPELLILDEPLVGLDVEAVELALSILRERCKQSGTTILMSSHNVHTLSQFTEEILYLRSGKLVQVDSVEDFFQAAREAAP